MASTQPKKGSLPVSSWDEILSDSDKRGFQTRIDPLIKQMLNNDPKAFDLAKDAINNLIINSNDDLTLIDCALLNLAFECSNSSLPGYSTLDVTHIASINQLLATIRGYIQKPSMKGPLVILMLASPGAGKSQLIRCLARHLASENVVAITYNMSGLQSNEDMIPPLDAARNRKVEDRIPLLFLDEFDSSPKFIPMLLPLLWDGEITIGQRELKLGKIVIVLAGSDPSLPATMEAARSMRLDVKIGGGSRPKMADLLSRINGGSFTIPTFFDASTGLDRKADKVCILVHLLRQKFGPALRSVPISLLRFVAKTEFRYGVRSIAHLVNSISGNDEKPETMTTADLKLPLTDVIELRLSSLAYHLLDTDEAHGVIKLWKNVSQIEYLMPLIVGLPSRRHFMQGRLLNRVAEFDIYRMLDGVFERGIKRPAKTKGKRMTKKKFSKKRVKKR